jgi:Mg/Co/Ni transporter MgtE
MIQDFSRVAAEVMNLIKAQQIEKAAQLVRKAHHSALTTSFKERQQTVHEVTLALAEARAQRSKVVQAVNELPPEQQFFARTQIEQICRALFDVQISEMQMRKRQLSRPR